MTTYLELRAKIARAIQDPDNETFSDDTIKDVVSSVWADLSRVAPQQFQEDITPLADTLSYPLRADIFPDPNPDIELRNVEIWDTTATPNTVAYWVTPKKAHFQDLAHSQAGWEVWNGTLYLPNRYVSLINVDDHVIRVWGYSPWPLPDTQQSIPGPTTGVAATNLITNADHGLVAGDAVQFTSLTGGAGITAAITYYVIASGLTADDFKISTTAGGAELDFTTDITEATLIKVVSVDADLLPFPHSYEEALVIGAHVGILRRLTNNRALFTAWQTRSNNTDVSMASLMNDLESAKDEWRRLTRAIQVAREGV